MNDQTITQNLGLYFAQHRVIKRHLSFFQRLRDVLGMGEGRQPTFGEAAALRALALA